MNVVQERLLHLLSCSTFQEEPFPRDWSAGEWQAIVSEADRHRLVPMLHHRLARRFPAGRVPAPAGEVLQRGYRFNTVRNFVRLRVLGAVLSRLAAAGIPVIVLKGAYLATSVYENIALRPMLDIDLLLHAEDITRADPVLLAADFRRIEPEAAASPGCNEIHYQLRSSPFRIEVHWELYAPDYPFRFALAEMWRAAVPASAAGVAARAFCPEDQLIHLASHATIHRFEFGLCSLIDIAEMIGRLRIDWPAMVDKARRQNVGRAVGVPLALARELLQVAVPAEAITGLEAGTMPQALFAEARETVLLNAREKRMKGEPNPNLLLFFGRRDWRHRLALVHSRLFPSRQALAAAYPVAADSLRIWLCYPRRFFSVFGRNLRGLWTIARRKVRHPLGRDRAGELMDWLLR